jgi:hypothetical protein
MTVQQAPVALSDEPRPYQFDFTKVSHDLNSWDAWLLTVLLAPHLNDDAVAQRLKDLTDGYTNVEIGITVNGIPCDATLLGARLRDVVTDTASREAQRLIREDPRVEAFLQTVESEQMALDTLTVAVRIAQRNLAAALGLPAFPDE